jgi:hypothetical protein
VNLAGMHGQRNTIVGNHRRIALDDAGQLETDGDGVSHVITLGPQVAAQRARASSHARVECLTQTSTRSNTRLDGRDARTES